MIEKGIPYVCIICENIFVKRKKGMKQKKYKINLRPYRCITCSDKCSKKYNRTLINKRNLLKAQWRLKNNVK